MNLFKDDREMPTPTVYCDVNCVYHKGEDICTAGKSRSVLPMR